MRYLLLFLLSLNLFTSSLFGVDATLKIEKDVEERSRIALMDGSSAPNAKAFNILFSDFKISGHFLVNESHTQGDFASNYLLPTLKSYEYVLKYDLVQSGGLKLSIRLLKASDGSEIFKKNYTMPDGNKLPFLLHNAVSDVNQALHYADISWIKRYVVFAVYTSAGKSEIRLADYTFNYQKTIMRGGLNLFPKWADENQRDIYYTSYKEIEPTLYKLNIYNGAKRRITSSEGMVVCSDVSKNGSKLLLTMAPKGQADIYEFSVGSGAKTQITNFNGIDVNGRYSEDESRVIFISNRLGYATVFQKSLYSSAATQVVHHGQKNSACDVHKETVVYSARESNSNSGRNSFNLYLTSLSGSDTRPITSSGSNQFPRFSTDGTVVLFLKQNGGMTSIGYTNILSHQSLLFPFNGQKIQSIDW